MVAWVNARLFDIAPGFFPVAFSSQRLLHPLLFARFEVEGVTFHFFDNVLLLHLSFKSAKGVFNRLALLQFYFCQL
jgi:hypothetical protein